MDQRHLDTRAAVLQNTLHEIQHRQADHPDVVERCCVICLDNIDLSEQARAQPCQHDHFDFVCLVSWLEEQTSCPLCKATITSLQYGFSDGGDYKTYQVPPKSSPSESPRALRIPRPPHRHVARPRSQRPYLPPSPNDEDDALQWRRAVYRRQLYSAHVGTNRLSRFRDLSPQLFNSDSELVSRARKWMRRELKVFDFLHAGESTATSPRHSSNAEFLLEYIVAILKTVDTQGSGGQAEEMLQEFVGRDHARLFLHELRAWLRSPYNSLSDWDRAVQYNETEARSEMDSRKINARRSRASGGGSWRPQRSDSHSASHRHRPYQSRRSYSRSTA